MVDCRSLILLSGDIVHKPRLSKMASLTNERLAIAEAKDVVHEHFCVDAGTLIGWSNGREDRFVHLEIYKW